MKTQYIIGIIVVVIVLAVGVVYMSKKPTPVKAGEYDGFAQCIKDKGTKFYGAWWCPHCRNEKALFGNSAHLLPYIECSTPDGNGQLPICVTNKIESYPTWEFADGKRQTGEVSLEELAEKTGCSLPEKK
jgi:hypothetical protein